MFIQVTTIDMHKPKGLAMWPVLEDLGRGALQDDRQRRMETQVVPFEPIPVQSSVLTSLSGRHRPKKVANDELLRKP